jgi:hypothetical protein
MTETKNRDMLAAALIFNLALVNLLAISVAANLEDASLFTYGWTQRLDSRHPSSDMADAREAISKMYIDNKISSRQELGSMLLKIFEAANCKPVVYDASLVWSAADVSPTCNCLNNMHLEYIKSVNPNGVNLTAIEMANNDTKMKTEIVVQAIKKKCFDAIRHTQVASPASCTFLLLHPSRSLIQVLLAD